MKNIFGKALKVLAASSIFYGLFLSDFFWPEGSFDQGKAVLITGGATGLGLALAKRLHARNRIELVLVCFRDCLKPEELASNFSHLKEVKVFQYEVNLLELDNIKSKFSQIFKKHDNIGYLVNNAGMPDFTLIKDMQYNSGQDHQYFRAIDLNFRAPVLLTHLFMEHYSSGHIHFSGSVVAYSSGLYASSYVASKHALAGFHRTLSSELKFASRNKLSPKKFTTGIINPYIFTSKMFEKATPPNILNLTNAVDLEVVADEYYKALKRKSSQTFVPHFFRYVCGISGFLSTEIQDSLFIPIYERFFKNWIHK